MNVKNFLILAIILIPVVSIEHAIGLGSSMDSDAYHHGDTLWYDSMTIEDYLEIPKTLDDECTTKFVLGTDKATLDAELAPYYGGGFCVNGGSFVNKTLGVGFGSVAKGALAFGGFSLSEGAGGWPAYSWAFVGNDEGVSVNLDSCTYKSGGTCVDAFPSAQIRGGIALKDCEYDAYGEACDINDAVICTGADSCYVAQGKIFFDNSDSSFIFVPNTITASTGLLTIKGNISSDADLTRRLGEPANRYTEIHTNDTYTTRIYGVEGDTARYWGVSTLDLGIFGTYPTLEPYSDGPLGNIGAVHNGMVVYTNPLTGDTIDPGLTMIKIGAGSANMVFDSSDNTFRFDAPIKLPNGFSEHFVHSDYKTSFYQNNNIFQIDANDTTMYTAFNMNVSAPEFIASIDMYTPTIIGTKTGDTTHLAIDSDVIIDNQQADIPTTLQIKSDRDSGLTLQDDITNQSIVTYGGNLILAPDAGHLEVIPAVNDTNFGTDEHPWNEGHFNYIYGDVSNVTGMPSSDFNDTGLLYQNGTRTLTGNWDTGGYDITAGRIKIYNTTSTAKVHLYPTGNFPSTNNGEFYVYSPDYTGGSGKYGGIYYDGSTHVMAGAYIYLQPALNSASYNKVFFYAHAVPTSDNTYNLGSITPDEQYWKNLYMKGNIVFGTSNTTDIGTSSSYANEVYAYQYYGKNDTILSFDDYEDTELVRNISPQVGNEKYFQMPNILFDNITEYYNKTVIDKEIEKNITEEINTTSLNMGKVIGLAYGTLKELIVRDDELTSEIDWLSIENQRLKEQITNICKENELKGCT